MRDYELSPTHSTVMRSHCYGSGLQQPQSVCLAIHVNVQAIKNEGIIVLSSMLAVPRTPHPPIVASSGFLLHLALDVLVVNSGLLTLQFPCHRSAKDLVRLPVPYGHHYERKHSLKHTLPLILRHSSKLHCLRLSFAHRQIFNKGTLCIEVPCLPHPPESHQ